MSNSGSSAPASGLFVTVWDGRSPVSAFEGARELLVSVRPDIVQLHTQPDPTDAPVLQAIRGLLPGVRLWLGAPSNPLAGMSDAKAVETVSRWAELARTWDVELVMLNGERPSRAGLPGWVPRTPELDTKAAKILDALTSRGVRVGWTSHDHLQWHPQPEPVLAPGSRVVCHAPQVYGADKDAWAAAPLGSVKGRWSKAAEQAATLARRGVIGERYAFGGASMAPYVQAHGVSTAATCWLLDRAPLAGAWAAPARIDAEGRRALLVDAALRRLVGDAPGRVERFQRTRGLAADGIVGPATLAALGVVG